MFIEHCQNCIFNGQTDTKPKQDDIAQGDILSLFIKPMPKVHSFEQTRDHTCFICCQGDPKSVLLCVHTVRQLLNVQLKTCQTTSERSHTARNRRQTALRLRIWFWCFGWVWQILNQKQIQTTIWSWGHNICKCLVEGLWSQSTLSFYLQ